MPEPVDVTDHPLTGRFVIDSEGAWLHNDVLITHERTWKYFSRSLHRDENGRYFITDGMVRVDVRAQDAPLVVIAVRASDDGFRLFFHDGTDDCLDPATLSFKGNVPYCTVRNGLAARFSTSAYMQLAESVRPVGEAFHLVIGDREYPLPPQT